MDFLLPIKTNKIRRMQFYSDEELSKLSRKDLEKAFLALQRTNQRLDFRAQAKKAEDYVAQKVNGQLCDSIHSSYDVLSGSGHKLEVKLSILIQPNKAGAPSSTVWKWNRLFGSDFGLAPLKIQFVPLIPGGSVTKTEQSCRR